ncbi:hypothetical protein MDA_GLEAN10013031 [Myotis davidii]|uniref:Uncharacterized protein n=1 Tax=Myotis davidii TaxID=225400 RepID=L5LQW8_MYODS|nr:hypothetical protein MDA_GLEAN10013031 [Myotis davidii]
MDHLGCNSNGDLAQPPGAKVPVGEQTQQHRDTERKWWLPAVLQPTEFENRLEERRRSANRLLNKPKVQCYQNIEGCV